MKPFEPFPFQCPTTYPVAAQLEMAKKTETMPGYLAKLATVPHLEVLTTVAGNSSTPTDDLDQLARHESPDVRLRVAGNIGTAVSTLERLSTDDYLAVRQKVAANPQTPSVLLDALIRDTEPAVVLRVLDNSKTPTSALSDFLTGERRFTERLAVARHPNLAASDMQVLAQNEDPWVRAEIAARLDLPPTVLASLADDRDPIASSAARKTQLTLAVRSLSGELRYVAEQLAETWTSDADTLIRTATGVLVPA